MGIMALKLLFDAAKAAPAALAAGKVAHKTKDFGRRVDAVFHPRKDVVTMKKSTFAALVVVLSAIAGALVAVYVYLRRREAELDEYERLLFSEDFSYEVPEAAAAEPAAPAQEAAPAEPEKPAKQPAKAKAVKTAAAQE